MPYLGARPVIRACCAVSLMLSLSGCLGPTAIKHTRLKYNEIYRSTNDEQLLLNIVRLRYADSPVFIDLPNITSQFEVAARGTYANGLDGQGPGSTNLGFGELLLRDSPTLSYHPREGREVAAALITPLTAEVLRAISPGVNTQQFLLMSVSDINDVPNIQLGTSFVPRTPDSNLTFRYGIELITRLQEQGAVELTITSHDSERFDPIPVQNVSSRDVLAAVKDGYVFRTEGDQASLSKREKSVMLKVHPDAVDSFEMRELARVFHVAPGRTSYKIKSEQDDVERDTDLPKPLVDSDTLLLNMRSPLQMMTFLSKGVCVPPEHVTQGIVPTTKGPDGCPYDWTQVTAGLFRVNVSHHRPLQAEVAVRYRGYWFSIAPNDVESRSALAILELLFAAQESEGAQLGPLLTLPIQ